MPCGGEGGAGIIQRIDIGRTTIWPDVHLACRPDTSITRIIVYFIKPIDQPFQRRHKLGVLGVQLPAFFAPMSDVGFQPFDDGSTAIHLG
jgi:hypothetical protein